MLISCVFDCVNLYYSDDGNFMNKMIFVVKNNAMAYHCGSDCFSREKYELFCLIMGCFNTQNSPSCFLREGKEDERI